MAPYQIFFFCCTVISVTIQAVGYHFFGVFLGGSDVFHYGGSVTSIEYTSYQDLSSLVVILFPVY